MNKIEKNKILLWLGSLLLAIGFLITFFRVELSAFINHWLLLIFQLPGFIIGIGVFFYLYLQGFIRFPILDKIIKLNDDKSNGNDEEGVEIDVRTILSEVIDKLSAFDEQSFDRSIDKSKSKRKEDRELNSKTRNSDEINSKNFIQSKLRMNILRMRMRLNKEISALNRKANINLIIGSLTTILSLGFIIYITSKAPDNFGEINNLLGYYFPRLTAIIFAQIFAYFFLKLYKNLLNEIKYYQNEITEIELIFVLLKTTEISEVKENYNLIIEEVMTRRRNLNFQQFDTKSQYNLEKPDLVKFKDFISQINKTEVT